MRLGHKQRVAEKILLVRHQLDVLLRPDLAAQERELCWNIAQKALDDIADATQGLYNRYVHYRKAAERVGRRGA